MPMAETPSASEVALRVGRITLEIAVQAALLLGDVLRASVRLCEVVHADVDVAGVGQAGDGEAENLQLRFRGGQVLLARCGAGA